MTPQIVLVAVLTLLGWSPIALASPIEGQLFGYQLGSRYPVTDDTKMVSWLGMPVILAEKPDKSPDFKRVEILATSKTFAIVNIYGVAEFPDEKQAKAFADRYTDLLETAHGSKCAKAERGSLWPESLKLVLVCKGRYELTVSYFGPDITRSKIYEVHIGLTFDSTSEAGQRMEAQAKQELNDHMAEGKTRRFEQATKEQKLRGLQ